MRLKPTIKGMKSVKTQEEPPKKTKTKKELPPDAYKPMFEPLKFLVRETPNMKQYVELSVKRFNEDLGLPYVWLQMYQESDMYTGYLKGKSVHFPLEMLYDIIDGLNDLSDECDKRHIE